MKKNILCCFILCICLFSSKAQISLSVSPDLSFPIHKTDEIGTSCGGVNSKIQYQLASSSIGIGYGIEKIKNAFSDDFIHSYNCNYAYTFPNHLFAGLEFGYCQRKIDNEFVQSSIYILPEIGIKNRFFQCKNLYYHYSLGYFLPLEREQIVSPAENYPKQNLSLIKLSIGLTYTFI